MEKVFVPLLATRFGIASTFFFTEYLRTSNRSCLAIVLRWCGVSVCVSIMSCHKSLAAPILAHQATVCRNLSYSFQLSKCLVLSQWLSATRFFSLSLSSLICLLWQFALTKSWQLVWKFSWNNNYISTKRQFTDIATLCGMTVRLCVCVCVCTNS